MLALGAAGACSLKTADEPATARPEILAVEVTPGSVRVQPGDSVAFHAKVNGTGPVPQGVRWSSTLQ
ncbi:MAG TPA: hypothetical protein VLS93_03310, partial [Anaeromyxobacteraceae bacterium]|nr:hypothetical protein [Anaeromyxobacteraceae bacterium]